MPNLHLGIARPRRAGAAPGVPAATSAMLVAPDQMDLGGSVIAGSIVCSWPGVRTSAVVRVTGAIRVQDRGRAAAQLGAEVSRLFV
jgi:hypothetical protein